MLTKQGCRLLNNANFLVTRVMKVKYYPETDFLQVKIGTNSNYMWRSIIATQDIIGKESRKRIGDGETINVWKIPWFPCTENGFLSSEMSPQLEHIRVVDGMDSDTKQ